MQEVTPEDIAYVTGYIQKKLNGQMAEKEYGQRLPPFSTCSQGLGLVFAEKINHVLSTTDLLSTKAIK